MAIIRKTSEGTVPTMRGAEWDPFRMMQEFFRFDRDPFRQMQPFAGERGFMPDFEVKETKDGYLFKADLPGVKDSDLDISISGNVLTISGKRDSEERQEGETFYAYERNFGAFTRSFTLPEAADADHVRADLKDGVLTLLLPKKPEMQPRKITIKAAGEGKEKMKA